MSEAATLRVLVVDDNRSAADAVALLLGREGHTVEVFHDGQSAIHRLAVQRFDMVLTDLRMEPVDGLAVVRAARAQTPPVEAIVFTAFGSVETAVEAMRLGAADFLTKPVTADQLLKRVRNYRKVPIEQGSIIGQSAATQLLRDQLVQVSRVRSTVLIQGETGTGKRHVARCLHQLGRDASLPIVVARPYEAVPTAQLHAAGMLLIPTVDEWSPEAMVGLLQQLETLEAGQPPRVVATATPAIDVRAARGEVPPELYFRLAVLVIRVSPIRERPDDIAPLLLHFLDTNAAAFGKEPPRPSLLQLEQLARHGWPGNIRELANLAERAVVLGRGAFDMSIKPAAPSPMAPHLAEGFNLTEHLEQIERELLVRAIDQTQGDRPNIGRLLGLERNTLRYKLNKYGLLDRT
jgi:DNA-binding NtrC family response regulator